MDELLRDLLNEPILGIRPSNSQFSAMYLVKMGEALLYLIIELIKTLLVLHLLHKQRVFEGKRMQSINNTVLFGMKQIFDEL